MSATPALPEPSDLAHSTQVSQRDEDAQYYRQVLNKLIAMGTDLAAAVHRQALTEPAQSQPASPGPTPNQAIAFDRLARTVRRTIALARKLSEPAREAPGPKLRPTECPNHRRPDCAATDAPDAEPWAEPCERAEGADYDADEDLYDDLDDDIDAEFDADFAELIARQYHSPLARLTDAELRALPTTQDAPESTQACAPGKTCRLCARAAKPTTAPPRITQPTQATPRPGTGPPRS